MAEKCIECKFWAAGECRRFPPTWVAWPNDNQHPVIYFPSTSFAQTGPDNWCGEFRFATCADMKREEGRFEEIARRKPATLQPAPSS